MQSIKFRATSFVVFYSIEVIDHLCRIEKTSREDACVYLNVSDERAAVPLQQDGTCRPAQLVVG